MNPPTKLSHEETLDWVRRHRAWRKAKKTRPIFARAIEPAEIGKEYVTADHANENAQEGFWLCVGSAEEPWFQKPEKVEAKYDFDGEEEKQFAFDDSPHAYRRYKPKPGVWNWAAQVEAPEIEGFYVRPSYDMQHPLYSPAGGYVVTEAVTDPYADKLADVWLVQQPLFESTYELEP